MALLAVCYVASLFLPGIYLVRGEPWGGFGILIWGWGGLLSGNGAWLANGLFIYATIATCFSKIVLALWLSGIAFLASLQTFFTNEINFISYKVGVLELGAGAYLWFASILGLFILCLINFMVRYDGRL